MDLQTLETAKEYKALIDSIEKDIEKQENIKRRMIQTTIRKVYIQTVGEGDIELSVSKETILKEIKYNLVVSRNRLETYKNYIKSL